MDDGGIVGVERIFSDLFSFDGGEGFEAAIDIRERSGNSRGEINDVDADISEDPFASVFLGKTPEPNGAGFPIAPSIGNEPALEVAGFEVGDFAEFAGLDKLDSFDPCGRAAVGELHEIDDPFFAGGLSHFFRVGVIGGEGFFAEDVESTLDGGEGDGGVESVRGDVGDGIKGNGIEHRFGIGKEMGNVVFFPKGLNAFFRDIASCNDFHSRDLLKSVCMRVGHAAGPDNS